MATLPEASLTINESAGAFAAGDGYAVVMAPVAQSADNVPRVFASTAGLLAQYLYSPAIDYCAMHFAETRKPVIFLGMPISVAGVIAWQNNSGVAGTSLVSVAVGSSGSLESVNGQITIVNGGTVGTDQITFDLSCDGGSTTQRIRLGTASSYTIPQFGLTLSFGAGTLIAADVFTWKSTAPMWGTTAISAARTALAAQQNLARSWLVVGSTQSSTYAGYVVAEADNYASANERFTYARVQIADAMHAQSSRIQAKMTGTPTITFSSTSHTITRSAGSFITDGFVTGQIVTVAGATASGDNGDLGACTVTSATVLTFSSGLVTEGPDVAGAVSVIASNGYTFTATTCTRTAGSFITEGFAVGQSVAITGTSLNNVTETITALSATVLTVAAGFAIEGPLMSSAVLIQQVSTFGADVAAQSAAYASIDAEKRTDLAYGHGRKISPITGWLLRRPAQWAASLREYQHDVQIPCWRKSDGPLTGWSITDANGNTVEYDERVYGGALAGRFTCLRSYANGPMGAFVALSLTRDSEGSLLSRTHNLAVANVGCTVVQAETENAIGTVLVLNADGTGTDASLSLIEKRVNRALQVNLLQQFAEGPRATSAVWSASRTDILNVPGATLNGTLALNLNGTLENINTSVVVQTAGAT